MTMRIWHKSSELPRKGSSIIMMQRNNGFIVGSIYGDQSIVVEFQRREMLHHQLADCELWAYVDDLANDARASIKPPTCEYRKDTNPSEFHSQYVTSCGNGYGLAFEWEMMPTFCCHCGLRVVEPEAT